MRSSTRGCVMAEPRVGDPAPVGEALAPAVQTAPARRTPGVRVPVAAAGGANGDGPKRPGGDPERRTLSTRQLAWKRFRRHKPALVGSVVLGIVILLCVFAPLIAKYDP